MRAHASPRRLGVAVAVGVLVGSSPFLGFQLLLALALAWLFGLNRLAVLLGVQVSAPPITPVLLFANLQVGALVLHGQFRSLSLERLRALPASEVVGALFLELLVGGLLVGGVLAAGLGWMTTRLVHRYRARQHVGAFLTPEQWEQLQARLDTLPRSWRSYARWKLRLDPVYALALAELPEDGELVDLGAGMGLLPLLLSLRSPSMRLRAVEWDTRKADVARQLLQGFPGTSVDVGDARRYELGSPLVVTLFDVLHYSPVEEQKAWLTRCAEALQPRGLLLVRELEPSMSRWPWTRLLEALAVRVGWNRGDGVQLYPPAEMAAALTALGFTVDLRRAGSGVFRANTLLVARKGAPSSIHGH